MNVLLLKFLIAHTTELNAVLSIWLKVLDDWPHFPLGLKELKITDRDTLMDTVLAAHPALANHLDQLKDIVSPETLEAVDAITLGETKINCIADYIMLVYLEDRMADKSVTGDELNRVMEDRDDLLNYWNQVKF